MIIEAKHWSARQTEDGNYHLSIHGELDTVVLHGLQHLGRSEIIDSIDQFVTLRKVRKQVKRVDAIIERVDRLAFINKLRKCSLSEDRRKCPPPMTEALFTFLAPKQSAVAQLGDLQELFEADTVRYGCRRARRFYRLRVARSLVPLILRKLTRMGIIGFIIDLGRRKLGL